MFCESMLDHTELFTPSPEERHDDRFANLPGTASDCQRRRLSHMSDKLPVKL